MIRSGKIEDKQVSHHPGVEACFLFYTLNLILHCVLVYEVLAGQGGQGATTGKIVQNEGGKSVDFRWCAMLKHVAVKGLLVRNR